MFSGEKSERDCLRSIVGSLFLRNSHLKAEQKNLANPSPKPLPHLSCLVKNGA